MANQRLAITGQTFGQLTALAPTERKSRGAVLWQFQCSCGALVEQAASRVAYGAVSRCRGCYLKSLRKGRKVKPRKVRVKKPRLLTLKIEFSGEYNSWKSMHYRCRGMCDAHRRNYLDRGIVVEEPRWAAFEEFLKDMGPRPLGTTLDRINNDEGYRPENCRWARVRQQLENTRVAHRVSVGGLELTATRVSELLGLSVSAVCSRIKKNGLRATSQWAEGLLKGSL